MYYKLCTILYYYSYLSVITMTIRHDQLKDVIKYFITCTHCTVINGIYMYCTLSSIVSWFYTFHENMHCNNN